MANLLDVNGLTVQTYDEINTALTDGFEGIYGTDVNLASNSPDGQMIGIFTKAVQDLLEFLVNIYNSFSITNCFGTTLHSRVALNGLVPKTGTYTTTPANVTADTAVTIYGLDELVSNPNVTVFTVMDSTTQWKLASTYVFGGAGTQALVFRALSIGVVTPLPNTITNIVTPISGITAVANPTIAGAVIGENEELDPALKIRHGKSFMLAATSPADAVEAALLNVPSIIDAIVLENTTSSPSGGIDANSIWAIVRGGTAATIAAAMYSKKAPGCGMTGGNTEPVARDNGQTWTAAWDTAIQQDLYVAFTIIPKIVGLTFDEVLLAQELAAALTYRINQVATVGDIIIAMNTIEPRAILTSVGVSRSAGSYTDTIGPTSALYYFTLSATNVAIT